MPIYVDNTLLSSMAKCTTQAQIRHGLGLTTPDDYATLRCGSAWHLAMECHLKGGLLEDCLDAFENDYYKWACANVAVGDRLSYENVIRILEAWLEDHALESMPYRVPGPDFVECGFAYPLDDEGEIMFCGRFDAAVQDRTTEDWYVLDHKTTGMITSDKVRKYQNDSQMSGYIWALQQQVPERARGAFINMIELKKLPGDKKRKCPTHGVVYAECGIMHSKRELFIIERTPEQLEAWRQTAVQLAMQYALTKQSVAGDLERAKYLPKEGTFNNSCEWCELRELCTMGFPRGLVQGNLIHHPWQPWAVEGDSK